MKLLRRLRDVVVQRILGLDDSPHRIAWGVFLGFVVAFSPTVGVQMFIYLAVAAVLRANKVSGLPVVWLTNPVTVVPVYYTCWRIGAFLLGTDDDLERGSRIVASLSGAEEGWRWDRLFEWEFWSQIAETLWDLGAELWVGGLVIGLVTGAIAYPITRYGVAAYRRVRS